MPKFPSLTVTPDTVTALLPVPALASVNANVPSLKESNVFPLLTLVYKVPVVTIAVPAVPAVNEPS